MTTTTPSPSSPRSPAVARARRARAPKKKFVYWTATETRQCLEGTAMAGGNFLRISKIVESRSSYMCRKHLRAMAERVLDGHGQISTADACVQVVLARLGVEPPPPSQLPACRDPNLPVFVQAVPQTDADEDVIRAMGRNPCVQIKTRSARCIWEIIVHLYQKWSKPLVLVRPDGSLLSPDDHAGSVLDLLQIPEDEDGVVQIEYKLMDLTIDEALLGNPGGGGAAGQPRGQPSRAQPGKAAAQMKPKLKKAKKRITPTPVLNEPAAPLVPPPLVNPKHLLTTVHKRPVVLQQVGQAQQTPLYFGQPTAPTPMSMVMGPPPVQPKAQVAQRTKKLAPKLILPAPEAPPAPAAQPVSMQAAAPKVDLIPAPPEHMQYPVPPPLPPRRKQPKRTYAGPPRELVEASAEDEADMEAPMPMSMSISNSVSGVGAASSSKKRPPLKPAKRLAKRLRTHDADTPRFLSKWAARYDSLDGTSDNEVPMETTTGAQPTKKKHVLNNINIDSVALAAQQLDMETAGNHLVAPISNSMFGGSGGRTLSLRLDLSAKLSAHMDVIEGTDPESPATPDATADVEDVEEAPPAPVEPAAEISRAESDFRVPPLLSDSVALAVTQPLSSDGVQQFMQLTGSMFGDPNANNSRSSAALPPLHLSRDGLHLSRDGLQNVNVHSQLLCSDNALDVHETETGSKTPPLPARLEINDPSLSFSKLFGRSITSN